MTEAQRERLTMLIEECSEVQKECTKILRHGYDNYHPDEPHITNKYNLEKELSDLLAILMIMISKDDLDVLSADFELYVDELENIWEKKLKWTRYQQ